MVMSGIQGLQSRSSMQQWKHAMVPKRHSLVQSTEDNGKLMNALLLQEHVEEGTGTPAIAIIQVKHWAAILHNISAGGAYRIPYSQQDCAVGKCIRLNQANS